MKRVFMLIKYIFVTKEFGFAVDFYLSDRKKWKRVRCMGSIKWLGSFFSAGQEATNANMM